MGTKPGEVMTKEEFCTRFMEDRRIEEYARRNSLKQHNNYAAEQASYREGIRHRGGHAYRR